MGNIIRGSVAYMARTSNVALARAWMNVDLVILLDVSISMNDRDNTPDRRITRAQRAIGATMARHPGRAAMILFGQRARLNIDGVLPDRAVDATTLIEPALRLFRDIAPPAAGVRGLIVTDGEFFDLDPALDAARGCAPCNGLYIGDPSRTRAREMLAAICRATGGSAEIDIAPAPALELIAQRLLAAPS